MVFQPVQEFSRVWFARRDDMRDDLAIDMSEIPQRMAFARAGEIDQPDQLAGTGKHVFQIQITMDHRTGAFHGSV